MVDGMRSSPLGLDLDLDDVRDALNRLRARAPRGEGDLLAGILTLLHDEEEATVHAVAVAATPPAWWELAYAGGPPVGPSELVRPLYFPGNPAGKPASSDGPDVLAVKRAVWRGGRWPGPASSFDDSFSKAFATGKGGNVIETGLAGFQRQMKLDATGQMGDATYQALRYARVPASLPGAGEPLFDATAVDLLERAATPPPNSAEANRAAIADYCERCIANEPAWHYSQARAMTHLGASPESSSEYADCSGHSTSAYYWAGAPDPNGRGYDGYGYTGTLIDNPRASAPWKVGDLALYGSSPSSTAHVTTCYRAGDDSSARWCSHGSEGAPTSVSLRYRADLLYVVRPAIA